MQQEAWGGEARRRLAEAIAELRERLQRAGRDGNGQSPEQRRQKLAQRRFARAARGQPGVSDGASGAGAPEDSDSDGDGDSDSDGDSMNAEGEGGDLPSASDGEKGGAGDRGRASLAGGSGAGESAGQGAQGTSATEGVPGTGNGIGNESGGAPLSHDKEAGSPRGRERSAAVRSAAGPKRSQVIEAAAARGFAHADYRRVYQDYGAVVEETLDASAVPPGQRYLVRRYFQLIRPRAAPPARPPSGGPNP
ncbi:MAG TPA: hypothetical protein VMU50_04775 [Polyangia bacterium]|nr:hypothetical protein [Polyangia bacterium]